jgi:hypothetical protein
LEALQYRAHRQELLSHLIHVTADFKIWNIH